MFIGSIKGGDASALFYSLVETCKLNGVEPEAWFTDVIERIGNHPIMFDDIARSASVTSRRCRRAPARPMAHRCSSTR